MQYTVNIAANQELGYSFYWITSNHVQYDSWKRWNSFSLLFKTIAPTFFNCAFLPLIQHYKNALYSIHLEKEIIFHKNNILACHLPKWMDSTLNYASGSHTFWSHDPLSHLKIPKDPQNIDAENNICRSITYISVFCILNCCNCASKANIPNTSTSEIFCFKHEYAFRLQIYKLEQNSNIIITFPIIVHICTCAWSAYILYKHNFYFQNIIKI